MRGGHVYRVDIVDWRDRPSTQFPISYYLDPIDSDNPVTRRDCTFEYVRDASGKVVEEVTYDRDHRELTHFLYISETRAEYRNNRNLPMAGVPSGAKIVEILPDKAGRDSTVHFLDAMLERRPNAEGAYGLKFDYDSRGFLVRFTYLDKQDKPFRANKGYASRVYERDAAGNIALVRFFDENNQQTWHKHGYAAQAYAYDANYRVVEERYLDENSKPVECANDYAIARYTYTAPSDYVVKYFDAQDRPHALFRLLSSTEYRVERLDDTGMMVRESYYGPDGKPVRLRAWCASKFVTYDREHRPVEIRYFGPDGAPTLTSNGYATETYKYDNNGNMLEWRCFDTNGEPTRNDQWIAGTRCEYDTLGRRTSELYVGTDNKPTLCADGFARKSMTYDQDGKLISEEFADAAGQPTRCQNGFHRVEYSYDASGFLSEERYFGPTGAPTWHKSGYAVKKRINDARGNPITLQSLADDRRGIIDWKGNSIVEYEYDAWGNLAKETHLGPDRSPEPIGNASVIIEREYNRLGLVVSETHFDGAHHRMASAEGYSQAVFEYGPGSFRLRSVYRDTAGKPWESADGTSILESSPDSRNNTAEDRHLNAQGELITKPGQVAIKRRTYDDRDLVTQVLTLDAKEQPIKSDSGYAQLVATYDERGRVREMRYLKGHGNPAMHNMGNAVVRKSYDDRDLVIEESYFDAQMKPAMANDCHRLQVVYDARGNRVEVRRLGLDGALKNGPQGFAREVADFDDRDHKTMQRYYAADGTPCPHKEGNYIVTWKFNECDEVTEHAFFDADRNLVLIPEYGYARLLQRYDNHGNRLVVEFRDAKDNLVVGKNGFARLIVEYDDQNRPRSSVLEDASGRRINRARITFVEQGGTGDTLGLKVGDVLKRYDGHEIETANEFIQSRQREKSDGPERMLVIERGGAEIEFKIAPGKLGINVEDKVKQSPVEASSKVSQVPPETESGDEP
jgi:YD repeat-containing protein